MNPRDFQCLGCETDGSEPFMLQREDYYMR
jgi:hypothetical protein